MERFTRENEELGSNSIGYKLFTFNCGRTFYPSNSLRSSSNNKREIFSDVFIFEKSERSEFYNLVIMKNNNHEIAWEKQYKEVYFTVGVGGVLIPDHELLQD